MDFQLSFCGMMVSEVDTKIKLFNFISFNTEH